MAKAKKVPVPIIPEFNVELILSADEADALMTILYRIGGSIQTRRRFTDSVLQALRQAGLKHTRADDILPQAGSIWFR